MHEYGLTKGIVRVALDAANRYGARRALTVRVVAGEDVGLIPESVQLYFDQIAAGTAVQGAKVLVTTVKPRMECPECGERFVRRPFSFECPRCGALGRPTDEGGAFYVESVELEGQDPSTERNEE